MFQPVGNLQLAFEGHDQYSEYYRELDIERAVTKTTYKVNGITYRREALASLPDRVVVMRISASEPGAISFKAWFNTPQPNVAMATTPGKELMISGTTMDHEGVKGVVRFNGIVRLKPEGGDLNADDTSLQVKNADAVTIYISIATNYNNYQDVSGDEKQACVGIPEQCLSKIV
jgi:hypothetical protein